MELKKLAQVRRFNRLVTQRIGALEETYLSRGRPLGEARVLFEIGQAGGIGLNALRTKLGLDSGYLSRLLRSLESGGVVQLDPDPDDGRARVARLTAKGEDEYRAYDEASDRLAASLLEPLSTGQRRRLIEAMAEVERLLRAGSLTVAVEAADSADASFCLRSYYDELARRFPNGFDPGAVANFDPAEMTPPKGWFVVARLEGAAVGCGALKRLDAAFGEVKRVWTSPSVRGMGIASRIMNRLEALAAEIGFRSVRLDTNGTLTEARALYLNRGYREIERYNDNPYADHWFEKDLGR